MKGRLSRKLGKRQLDVSLDQVTNTELLTAIEDATVDFKKETDINTLIEAHTAVTSKQTASQVNALIDDHENVRTAQELNTYINDQLNTNSLVTGKQNQLTFQKATLGSGVGDLEFDDATSTFDYTPPSFDGLATTSDLAGLATTAALDTLETNTLNALGALNSNKANVTDLAGKADLSGCTFTGGVLFNATGGANVATNGHLTVNGASSASNNMSDLRVYGKGQYDRGRLTITNINVSPWAENYQHWDGGTFKIRNKPLFASGTGNTVNTYPMYQGNQWKAEMGVYRGNNNSTVSKIQPYANGQIYYTGPLSSTSDDRIKSYTENVTNATDTILHCEPKKYKKHEDFQTDSETPDLEGVDWRWEYGLVAQDLQADDTLQHFVSQNPETGLHHVNYTEMIPLLLQSIKELHARLAVLEGA